ncbi:MAG: UDP-N-acetylmuramoyl-L-alanine--D-glutamate ligase, partial [Thermodesulfovibrionales bacterium]
PDHLDRYSSMVQYREAKARIGLNMKEGDFLVLNGDDTELMGLSDRFSSEVVYFSRRGPVRGAYVEDGGIRLRFKDKDLMISLQGMRIKGVHNIENAMAASLMAFIAGADREAIERILTEFRGLEHRTEFVEEIDGVNYINDSKGTNIGALMKSIEGFYNVILIAGGRDKKGDFTVLRPLIKERVKTLILLGEARDKIMKSLGDLVPTLIASDMRDAVYKARLTASPGDTVLLSPGCASFDMFRDFEDRGRVFKNIVRELKGGIRQD